MSTTSNRGFAGFMARVHAHPRARLLEFLLWGIPGAILIAVSVAAYLLQWNQGAFPAIGVVIGLSFVGWGLLPPAKPKNAEAGPISTKSKRR